METVIEVNELQRTFGEQKAVDGITFQVAPGEVFGLLGPNGAGKTTTVRLLNGMLPPSAGTAHVFGLDPAEKGEAVRRRTGVLTENTSLYERLSARENLLFFGTLAEVEEAALERRVSELLSFFELESRAKSGQKSDWRADLEKIAAELARVCDSLRTEFGLEEPARKTG